MTWWSTAAPAAPSGRWAAFDAITRTLETMEKDETLLVQSGKPVGVFRTNEWAPRVLLANSNLVGDWANWPEFRRLEAEGLMMYGQMTAGSWIYIGTQGILQGTFETFAAIARKLTGDENGTLAGTLTLTGGCGGMGGAQPLAVTLNDGACLIVDVDETRLRRRAGKRYLDEVETDLDAAIAKVLKAKEERRGWSVGYVGNAAEVFPEILRRHNAGELTVDIVTDQTSAHDPLSYLPEGITVEEWHREAAADPGRLHQEGPGLDGQARPGHGRVPGRRRRGLRLRQLHPRRGPQGRLQPRLRIPRLRPGLHPPAVLRGPRPVPLGGALRRPRGHRGHGRGHQGALPREQAPAPLDRRRRRNGSSSRACRPASAGSATANAPRPACCSTSSSRRARSRRPS